MALQQQELSITFTEGIDTKTDAKLATKLDSLENGFIGQTGTIQKRNGFSSLPTAVYLRPSEPIIAGELLVTNKDEILNLSKDGGFLYNKSLGDKWTSEFGGGTPFKQYQIKLKTFKPQEAFKYNLSFFKEETATQEIYLCHQGSFTLVYNSGVSTIYRVDKETGSIFYDDPGSGDGGWQYDNAYLLNVGGKILKILKSGAVISALDVTTSSQGIPTALVTDAATIQDPGQYNAFSINGSLFIVYVDVSASSVSSTIKVKQFSNTFTLLNSLSFTEPEIAAYGFALERNVSTGNYELFYHLSPVLDPFKKLYCKTLSPTLSVLSTSFINFTATNLGAFQGIAKTACYDPSTTSVYCFTNEPKASEETVACYEITSASVLASFSLPIRNAKLSSGAFFFDGQTMVSIAKISDASTIPDYLRINVLINKFGDLVSNISDQTISDAGYDLALGKPSNNVLPIPSSKNGALLATINISNYDCSSPKEIINKGVFATGGIFEFCSSRIYETSFLHSPLIGPTPVISSGNIPIGNYDYCAVYEYFDINNQLSESTVSNVVTVNLSSPSKVVFDIDNPLTRRPNGSVQIALYRKLTTDTVFKFTAYGSVDNSLDNSRGKTLYTTGGVVQETPPPVSNIFTIHGDRLFCVDEEDKNVIFFTKKTQPGRGLRFSTVIFYLVINDNKTGFAEEITGLGSLDDKLIVFKDHSIYAVFGDGPNGLGQGNFSEPKLISTDVGCRDARSIVNSSEGLYFMSNKGIYLLDRSLQVTYIGADVEDYNSLEITSAVLIPNINQIRFTTRDGVALIYNYYYRAWSTFSNYSSNHAVIWLDKYCHLKSNGVVNVETSGYLDNATPIKIRIVQSWLKANGIQHLQRMYRMMFIGDWKSSHKVTVNLSYDYENYVWDSYTIVPLASDYNRVDKPSLSSLYTGANDGIYQYEIHLARQKCQSIRFEIFDTDIVGESFTLTGLSFIIGIKTGLDKLTSNKKF